MTRAADPYLARLQHREELLSAGELKRINALWQTAEWPNTTGAHAKDGYRRPFDYYLERVRYLGLSGGLLVDAGCGGGEWSFAWATRFERVVGFDIDSARVAAANWHKQRFDLPPVEFITGDIRSVPAADETVDVLYCNDVVWGVIPIEPILREFFRVLKVGGICYLGLPGPGLTQGHPRDGNPQIVDVSRRRIYNTLCRRHLKSLVCAIGPGWARNAEAAECLRREMSPVDMLARLNCPPDQIMAAKTIADDLGQEFSQSLLDDLAAITAGTKADFGDRSAGRDWNTHELSVAASEAGFGRMEWAPEGWLSLKHDGEIEKAPRRDATPGIRDLEGGLSAVEMLLWKPTRRTPRESSRQSPESVAPAVKAEICRTSDEKWKYTSENTTYWNGQSREFLSPLIERRPPVLTELAEAIITPRYVEPKRGALLVATGGIYNRDHELLAPFREREAYETLRNHFMRLRNPPLLSQKRIDNAVRLSGTYLYLGILRNHFGHFLLETLSHAWYLLKADPAVKVIFLQYESLGMLPAFARYIFRVLELNPERIILVTRTSIVEHLLFPESEFEIRWKAHSSYADTFRELVQRSSRLFPARDTPERIYLTRRQLKPENSRNPDRIVTNETDVEALFERRKFAIIAPESLPLHEQIALAAGARQVAGLKGSALHLSLFSTQPEARLIQIGQEQLMNQSLIDRLKNMESHQIFCDSKRTELGRAVDLDIIDAALREM